MGLKGQHRSQVYLFNINTCFFFFCFQLSEKPHSSLFTEDESKLSVSFIFKKIDLLFLVSSSTYSSFLLRPLFLQWKWNKSWGRRSSGYSGGFPMSPTQWISTFWDCSWWQRTLRRGNVLHKQDPGGREALCRDHKLHQAGSQRLQDCCCCGVFPGQRGEMTGTKDETSLPTGYRAARLNSDKSWCGTKWWGLGQEHYGPYGSHFWLIVGVYTFHAAPLETCLERWDNRSQWNRNFDSCLIIQPSSLLRMWTYSAQVYKIPEMK